MRRTGSGARGPFRRVRPFGAGTSRAGGAGTAVSTTPGHPVRKIRPGSRCVLGIRSEARPYQYRDGKSGARMTARFEQRLSRLEQRAQVAGVACTCPPRMPIVFCGDPPPDIEPCPIHGPVTATCLALAADFSDQYVFITYPGGQSILARFLAASVGHWEDYFGLETLIEPGLLLPLAFLKRQRPAGGCTVKSGVFRERVALSCRHARNCADAAQRTTNAQTTDRGSRRSVAGASVRTDRSPKPIRERPQIWLKIISCPLRCRRFRH
jgi:hypothetical protein